MVLSSAGFADGRKTKAGAWNDTDADPIEPGYHIQMEAGSTRSRWRAQPLKGFDLAVTNGGADHFTIMWWNRKGIDSGGRGIRVMGRKKKRD